MMLEQKKQGEENRGSRSLMIDNNSGSKNNHPPNDISSIRTTTTRYARPNNYLEFRKQLEHQTAERIDTNLNNIRNKTPQGSLQERLMQVPNTQLLAVIDPSLLLSHSQHIRWPDHFQKQITVMKWFCILALSLGAMMISSQFAIYSLYLHDVWKVSPVFAGTSMAIGELSGMITLMASIYWDTNKISKKKSVSTNDGDNITSNDEGNKKNNDCRHRRTSITTLGTVIVKDQKSDVGIGRNSSCCSKCLRTPSLLLQVPSMFVMCCLAAVIPLSLLGFVKPQYDNEEQFEEEEKLLGTSNVSDWPTGLYFALLSGILIGLVNSVLHSTVIEMTALILPEDLFQSAVAWGYFFKRITNLAVCLIATLLYIWSEYAVYQTIAFLYLLSVPVSIYVLAWFVKCMPWQMDREILFSEECFEEDEISPTLRRQRPSAEGNDSFDGNEREFEPNKM